MGDGGRILGGGGGVRVKTWSSTKLVLLRLHYVYHQRFLALGLFHTQNDLSSWEGTFDFIADIASIFVNSINWLKLFEEVELTVTIIDIIQLTQWSIIWRTESRYIFISMQETTNYVPGLRVYLVCHCCSICEGLCKDRSRIQRLVRI